MKQVKARKVMVKRLGTTSLDDIKLGSNAHLRPEVMKAAMMMMARRSW